MTARLITHESERTMADFKEITNAVEKATVNATVSWSLVDTLSNAAMLICLVVLCLATRQMSSKFLWASIGLAAIACVGKYLVLTELRKRRAK